MNLILRSFNMLLNCSHATGFAISPYEFSCKTRSHDIIVLPINPNSELASIYRVAHPSKILRVLSQLHLAPHGAASPGRISYQAVEPRTRHCPLETASHATTYHFPIGFISKEDQDSTMSAYNARIPVYRIHRCFFNIADQ